MTTTHKKTTIGLDLGDRQLPVCALSEEGKILAETNIPNSREALSKLSEEYPQANIAMETGTHSPWISRHLQSRNHKVLVANARKLRAIYKNTNKCDKVDARMLARLGRADPELLSPIKHRSEACQRDLVNLKARHALVRSRVSLINAVRALLKSLGIRLPSGCSAESFTKKARGHLASTDLDLVESLLVQIDHLNATIKHLDKKIEVLSTAKYQETVRLRELPGVGPLTALCFVLTLEEHQRFRKSREVGAFLGLTPKRDQSGDSDKQLPISKAGNAGLRCLLVNCAHHILGPFGADNPMRQAGLRICERGGPNAKKKAVIAVARKLSVTMHAIWRSGQAYQSHVPAA